jgi:hypothetical protein
MDWDHTPPPPHLDESVLQAVADGYASIFRRLFPQRAQELDI